MAQAWALKHSPPPRTLLRLKAWSERAWATYWSAQARRATVMVLRSLDDRTLKDIGMDRSEIESVVYARAGERRPECCA